MKQPRNREAHVPCAGAVALLRRVPREAPAPAGLQHLEAARSAEEAGPEGTEGTEGRPIPHPPCGQDKPPTRSHHRGPGRSDNVRGRLLVSDGTCGMEGDKPDAAAAVCPQEEVSHVERQTGREPRGKVAGGGRQWGGGRRSLHFSFNFLVGLKIVKRKNKCVLEDRENRKSRKFL